MITTKPKFSTSLLNNCTPETRLRQFGLTIIQCFSPKYKRTRYIRYCTNITDEEIQKSTFNKNKLECYRSINTFRGKSRTISNLAGLNAAFIDIDCEKYGVSKEQVLSVLYECVIAADLWYKDVLLTPTYITDSGHGLHLIFVFKNQIIANSIKWVNLWERLENELLDRMNNAFIIMFGKPLCDHSSIDPARMLRIPGTYNNKDQKHPLLCKIVEENNLTYDMGKLCYDILPPKPWENDSKPQLKPVRKQNKANKAKNKATKRNYTSDINLTRARDIEKLVQLRNYKVAGYRNNIVFIYSTCLVAAGFNDEQVMNALIELNGSFRAPLTLTELRAMKYNIKRKRKATVTSKDDKNKQTNDQSREYYVFKNATIIDWLNITDDEQVRMKTIIGKDEKYRRKNVARNNHRRKYSATKGAKHKREQRNKQIRELHDKGMKPAAIAKELGISKRTVYYAINNK